MSGYLSHLLGYVLKIFKKDTNSKRNGSISAPTTPLRFNSITEEIEKPNGTVTSKVCNSSLLTNLKRFKSCPEIDEDICNEAGNGQDCRICSEKFIILGARENAISIHKKSDSLNIKPNDSCSNSWNSVGFVGKVKIFQNEPLLRRFHSLEIKSGESDQVDVRKDKQLRKSFPETHTLAAGDGPHIISDSFKTELENLRSKNSNSSKINEIGEMDWKTKTDNWSPEKHDDELSSERFDTKIPEYHSFQPSLMTDNVSVQLKFKQALESSPIKRNIFTSFHQDRRLSCRSKIPVHQENRRASEGYKILTCTQSGWRRASRTNIYDYYERNRMLQSRSKRKPVARKAHSSTTIAYRSQLDAKLDRMFRKFSKKIYQGNIIDHYSHGRWMRLAGIFEDSMALSFKNYAKCKVVLNLSEYKEFLLSMCEEHDLDYWDVLKKMTDVNIKSETCFPSASVEERYERVNKDESSST